MNEALESENESEKVVREVIEHQASKKVRITEIYSPSLKNKLLIKNSKVPIVSSYRKRLEL